MHIHHLIAGLPITLARGDVTAPVSAIVEDSRQASRGCLFVARSGTKVDGRQFVADAVRAGATAVLTNDAAAVPPNVAALVADDVPLAATQLAERFYGNPSRKLNLIGITGTNGKTTTAYLIHQTLNAAGVRCGLMGTVQIDDGAQLLPAELTTPGSIQISRLLAAMVANGCRACVMETSSHALAQKRTAGLAFKVGIFTNLTGDHLDFHKTMEAYLDAKAILFESLPDNGGMGGGAAIVNIDDPAGAAIIDRTKAHPISCSAQSEPARLGGRAGASCTVQITSQSLRGLDARFNGPWGTIDCHLPLIGRHNAMNALQAIAACHASGLDAQTLRNGLTSCKAPPGRLEPVGESDQGFAILVDYAHTDDALENVLRTLRPIVNEAGSGRLRVVFGCGGDRDRTKRPRMARIACKYADDVIVTSDNPRTENPAAIIDEICAGVPSDRLGIVQRIVDRRAAIYAAIERSRDGDIVLIAGKGHEDYQIIGAIKHPFDDHKVAAQALAARREGVAS